MHWRRPFLHSLPYLEETSVNQEKCLVQLQHLLTCCQALSPYLPVEYIPEHSVGFSPFLFLSPDGWVDASMNTVHRPLLVHPGANRRLETGDWRSEIGDQRLEIGDWRPETRYQILEPAPGGSTSKTHPLSTHSHTSTPLLSKMCVCEGGGGVCVTDSFYSTQAFIFFCLN